MKGKKLKIIGAIFVMMVILCGNFLAAANYYNNKLSVFNNRKKVINPLDNIINPGGYIDYVIELDDSLEGNVVFSLQLDNLDLKTSECIMLEINYDNFYSDILPLSTFDDWVDFNLSLKETRIITLRFMMPYDSGNEMQNLDLTFALNLRISRL